MIAYWPEDWMDALSLSREYSQQRKKRMEKLEKRGPGFVDKTQSGIVVRPDPFSKTVYRKSSDVVAKEASPVVVNKVEKVVTTPKPVIKMDKRRKSAVVKEEPIDLT